jgi:hypothetical protein
MGPSVLKASWAISIVNVGLKTKDSLGLKHKVNVEM